MNNSRTTTAPQTLCVRISDSVARRARQYVENGTSGYDSINELVEVAIENLLNIEAVPNVGAPTMEVGTTTVSDATVRRGAGSGRSSDGSAAVVPTPASGWNQLKDVLAHPTRGSTVHELLAPIPEASQLPPFAEPTPPSKAPLFVLTNRLSPVKVATRVLANMQLATGDSAQLRLFRRRAATAARLLGLWLRMRDDGKSAEARRWVAYPIGADEEKSIGRFEKSFTLDVESSGAIIGPMAQLGLANFADGGRVQLTEAGWRLASLASPLLDEAQGDTCSPEEAAQLRALITTRMPGETDTIVEFLDLVRRANGKQSRLDEFLNQRHPEWTANLAIARRAALAGRLSDLEVVRLEGRGSHATLHLLPSASEFTTGHH